MDRPAPDNEFVTAGGRPAGPGETPVPELSVPGTDKTLQQDPNENETHIVDADATKKSVGEEAQMKYGELKAQAQNGVETGHKVQDADTELPQEPEEKKTGMREKMRQMGVSLNSSYISAHILTLGFVE